MAEVFQENGLIKSVYKKIIQIGEFSGQSRKKSWLKLSGGEIQTVKKENGKRDESKGR